MKTNTQSLTGEELENKLSKSTPGTTLRIYGPDGWSMVTHYVGRVGEPLHRLVETSLSGERVKVYEVDAYHRLARGVGERNKVEFLVEYIEEEDG